MPNDWQYPIKCEFNFILLRIKKKKSYVSTPQEILTLASNIGYCQCHM